MGISTADATRRYLDGETIKAIGALYGVAASTVARRLRAAGVKLRPRGTPPHDPDEIDAVILRLYGQRMPRRAIARVLGMTHQAVQQRIRKLEEMEVWP